jgi:hypothetical protein
VRTLDKAEVIGAILEWPGLYETEGGDLLLGMPVSQVPSQLINCHWRNVSRIDESDLKRMGLEIVTARYVGGCSPKRFCRVAVAERVCHNVGPCDKGPCHVVDSSVDCYSANVWGQEIES